MLGSCVQNNDMGNKWKRDEEGSINGS